MRYLFAVLFLSLGCGDDLPIQDHICRACGTEGFTCPVTLTECIKTGACETNGPGDLVLYANGTYKQTNQSGMYTYKNGILFVNGTIIPWSRNICKYDSDAGGQ